jgi:hypothetical protein
MTEFNTPSLPPPPPPPPPAPARTTIDFAKPFTFVFEDPEWLKKIVIGGLMYLASFVLVGLFFVLGYCAKLARNVVEGIERPLPDWDDLGGYFSEGLKLFVVILGYMLPMLLVVGLLVAGSVLFGSLGEDNPMSGCAVACAWVLLLPLYLVVLIVAPAGLVYAMVTGDVGTAFNFPLLWRFIKANAANYALAFVVYMVANFISQFGIILLCIGVIFTGFWSIVVTIYAFASAYAMAKER